MADKMATEEKIAELFFGLIMALNLTNIMRLALVGQSNTFILNTVTFALLGGNLAWGLADGIMNALSRNVRLHREFYALDDLSRIEDSVAAKQEAKRIVKKGMPRLQAELVDDTMLDAMASHLVEQVRSKKITHPTLGAEGWTVLFMTVLLNLLAAFPILAVYFFVGPTSVNEATIIANLVGMVVLFIMGLYLGRHTHGRLHLYTGLVMMFIGLAMVFATVVLGGGFG